MNIDVKYTIFENGTFNSSAIISYNGHFIVSAEKSDEFESLDFQSENGFTIAYGIPFEKVPEYLKTNFNFQDNEIKTICSILIKNFTRIK